MIQGGEKYEMKISIKRINDMKMQRFSSNVKIIVDGKILQQVGEFWNPSLGSVFLANEHSEKDIGGIVGIAEQISTRCQQYCLVDKFKAKETFFKTLV